MIIQNSLIIQQAYLESGLKILENNLESSKNLIKYESLRNNLEFLINIAEGVRFRSKCDIELTEQDL